MATYYCRTGGADSGGQHDGTVDSDTRAWLTMKPFLNAARNPGDTLIIHSGTYDYAGVRGFAVNSNCSGNSGAWILVQAATGETVTINDTTKASGHRCIYLQSCSYIRFENIDFTNWDCVFYAIQQTPTTANGPHHIYIYQCDSNGGGPFGGAYGFITWKRSGTDTGVTVTPPHDFTVDGCNIGYHDYGLCGQHGVYNITVQNCEIHHTSSSVADADGFSIDNNVSASAGYPPSHDLVVDNCNFHDTGTNATAWIDWKAMGNNNVIKNSTFSLCGQVGFKLWVPHNGDTTFYRAKFTLTDNVITHDPTSAEYCVKSFGMPDFDFQRNNFSLHAGSNGAVTWTWGNNADDSNMSTNGPPAANTWVDYDGTTAWTPNPTFHSRYNNYHVEAGHSTIYPVYGAPSYQSNRGGKNEINGTMDMDYDTFYNHDGDTRALSLIEEDAVSGDTAHNYGSTGMPWDMSAWATAYGGSQEQSGYWNATWQEYVPPAEGGTPMRMMMGLGL
jgi:hypothetical protein